MPIPPTVTRRGFLAGALATATAPVFIPASALGKDGRPAPSERVVMGCIGMGWQGGSNLGSFLGQSDCQVVAVCDVDRQHLDEAADRINKHYKNEDCKKYADFREICARADIDALSIATPDHWHALTSIEAAKNGKDIYGEKPLSKTHAEGVAMVKAVKAAGRIWQTGSWQRSQANFRQGVGLVRGGHIGKLVRVEVGLPGGHADFAKTGDRKSVEAVPENLDYDFWCGPSKVLPYIPARHHKNWRWCWEYGGGQLMDWIGHHCDIAHWGMDMDLGGPMEVKGTSVMPPADAVWNTPGEYRVDCKYPGGIEMVIANSHGRKFGDPFEEGKLYGGTRWIGENGWVHVNRGQFETSDPELRKQALEWDKQGKFDSVYRSENHFRNFLDCVKSRQPAITPAEVAHRSATPGHLGMVSILLGGRALNWDAQKEEIAGDSEASALLGRPFREPWKL